MLKSQTMSSLPPFKPHFLSASSSSSSHSLKRKRGLSAISTIPPTPPRSSPALPGNEDNMRISTNIPGMNVFRYEVEREGRGKEGEGGERDSGASSPRTKVACNLDGLKLEDAGLVGRFELGGPPLKPWKKLFGGFGGNRAFDERLMNEYSDVDVGLTGNGDADRAENQQLARKKAKVVRQNRRVEVPETPRSVEAGSGVGLGLGWRRENEAKSGIFIGDISTLRPVTEKSATGETLSHSVDEMVFTGRGTGNGNGNGDGDGELVGSYPFINRLVQSKSRKKRAGTPPLMSSSIDEYREENGDLREISCLTWHDDEITGHDPTDPDDDGEGINGIGFKPTPAEAYARTQKRRQQMLEYRNREAREARKIRSEKRRGNEMKRSGEEMDSARRVRFIEGEGKSVVLNG